MNTSKTSASEQELLTVGHGKKLFDQSKAISAKLTELAPLLGLLEQPKYEEGQDPIAHMVRLLETLTDHSQRQTALLEVIDGKLDFVLAASSTSER